MVRDFSDKSKQSMLQMIDEIEKENGGFWNDLIGDLWNRFLNWIGLLNIKHYVDSAGAYHRKVFDMKNADKKKIEKIFNDVEKVDSLYQANLSNVTKVLDYWHNYINKLSEIMIADNGSLAKDFNRYELDKIRNDISSVDLKAKEVLSYQDVVNRILSALKSGSKIAGKLFDNQVKKQQGLNQIIQTPDQSNKYRSFSGAAGLAGGTLSFLTGLYSLVTNQYKNGWDYSKGVLGLTKSLGDYNSVVYKFMINSKIKDGDFTLASGYEHANQTKMGIVSLVANIAGLSKEFISSVQIQMDKDAQLYEKLIQHITSVESVLDVAESGFNLKFGHKIYTFTKLQGIKMEALPQNAKILGKISAVVTIANTFLDSTKGGIEKYHDVTQDEHFDMDDMADVGMAFALKGLASELNSITFGISDGVLNISGYTDTLIEGTKNVAPVISEYYMKQPVSKMYVENTKWMKDVADNEDNNVIARSIVGASLGAGMIGAMAIDNVVSVPLSWMKCGWNYAQQIIINKIK